ncbi:MAG: hypothetical protein DYG83_09495 [Candidatus Brocadia sp. AMX2]|nr:MAG: hypothetical protein EDM70_05325 [Candidatus Brocadia sp. AMX2]MBC6932600.1 hypothetical protein [Candidatus Brocadia sp.]MBL1169884.1 hypothetical protein [Candidatus Brocadia sp. AMX1]MCE7867044.1 hypothetical protein [Candidatus Brocadia sp. AMX2]MCQ3917641.1 hypothetical protein [Candidatus Brocadia sp.]
MPIGRTSIPEVLPFSFIIYNRNVIVNLDFRVVDNNPFNKGSQEGLLFGNWAFMEKVGKVLNIVF